MCFQDLFRIRREARSHFLFPLFYVHTYVVVCSTMLHFVLFAFLCVVLLFFCFLSALCLHLPSVSSYLSGYASPSWVGLNELPNCEAFCFSSTLVQFSLQPSPNTQYWYMYHHSLCMCVIFVFALFVSCLHFFFFSFFFFFLINRRDSTIEQYRA
jgi:hypothetical protein